ncbi:hypothetical protein Rhe02_42460 [Rhizocola hellebori]|uniref:Carrier domain-containing protein n=1 Tax=Rhizocola hellebori TaxID=1392758 RepID=A0A8J3Q8U9_9ACTN|nr:amino acid adenylation domain-containing protein [Rhizocola hellebori]GIH06179.1 hypothetical protein Rhe02_42460 [Rhizocola hellebori]
MIEASPFQHGMWLTERLGIAGSAYRMPLPVVFDGPLDRAAMLRACAAMLIRHPILGCDFDEVDGVLQLRPDGGGHFDYSLVELAPQRHLLRFEAHHLVFDGTSKDILLRDLAKAYAGEQLAPLGFSEPEPGDVALAKHYWAARWREPQEVVLPGLSGQVRTARAGECFDFELAHVKFDVLFAALQALLTRYGNAEPVIAIDLGTRTPATQDAIGLYVNELPVFPGDDLRELYQVRRVPISQAVSGLSPRLAMAPVSISYRRRAPDVTFHGLSAAVDWMAFHGTARNALHVQMVDDGTTIQARLHFDPEAIARPYVEQIAQEYLGEISALADGVPYAGKVSHLAGPRREYPGPQTVHELVTQQAARTPETVAVTGTTGTLTYAELVASAGETAAALRERGIRPGDRVAVRMHRSPDLVAKLLGVWLAGAAYVPIDPDYPASRQSLLLSDAAPAALLTEAGIVQLPGGARNPEDLAYVIYTSGSTGRPKGVQVGHGSVVNLLHCLRDALGAGVWLATASYSFDMSVPELWLPLISGGTVVLAGEQETRDAEKLLKLIRGCAVTHVHVTPSTWQRLLEAGFDEPGVIAIAGAEALPQPLAKRLRGCSAQLWNLYGPTETTVWSTMARLDGATVTIGRPLPNTDLHVLDGQLRAVPIGIAGELCIGGRGLAHGYLDRPALNEERFVPTEWGRLYRTGDRVRLLADGQLEWIGRFDDQIKLRGYRIELGEIQSQLLDYPGVRAAAVVADPELTAYVVGPVEGLKEHLAQALPAYMVPSRFLSLAALPLTPNGKLDRSALAAAPVEQPAGTAFTGLAEQVYQVWSEVLGRSDIGADDSLFDLGGHSLTVTRISSRLRKRGLAVPLHVFFDHPTISGIVAAIEQP